MKLTVGVSFAMMLLKFFHILPVISGWVYPVFQHLGLPGDAALVYVSGYFVNVYSALAVLSTVEMDTRAITIIGTMILLSHSMIVETAVLKKIGCRGWEMVLIRTLSAFVMAFILNKILPGEGATRATTFSATGAISWAAFGLALKEWALSALKLVVTLVCVIYTMNILQRVLTEFGIMGIIMKPFKPLIRIFGLPQSTTFLWLVCNVIGLGYGAAALLDEMDRGGVSQEEARLLGYHVSVNHSNIEDLLLITFSGAIWWILLLSRCLLATLLVWSARLLSSLHRKAAAA